MLPIVHQHHPSVVMGDDGVSHVQSFDLGEADASTGNPAELAQAVAPLRDARFAYAEAEKNLGDMLMRSMRSQKPIRIGCHHPGEPSRIRRNRTNPMPLLSTTANSPQILGFFVGFLILFAVRVVTAFEHIKPEWTDVWNSAFYLVGLVDNRWTTVRIGSASMWQLGFWMPSTWHARSGTLRRRWC